MELSNNQQAFLALVQAGLWTDTGSMDLGIHRFTESVDWGVVYQLAAEQSVQGLVLQGLEWYKEHKPKYVANISQNILLQWIGGVQMIEQQNIAMNTFVTNVIDKLRSEDVNAILVKGQGIAQCYKKPLWRVSGDVDLLLSEQNYEKAKKVLLPVAVEVEKEYKAFKHQGMTMAGGYVVELHGTMYSRLSKRIDRVIDEVQEECLFAGSVRSEGFKCSWTSQAAEPSARVHVFLPSPDNDVIFVFTHILHHFYIEGIGLRQICDWCRLLWTFRDSLNHDLLESRIRRMGLMSEWKAFGTFAVEYLGMPVEAIPLYNKFNSSKDQKFKKKADRIMEFVLECGNFGHNRESAKSKIGSAWLKIKDFVHHTKVFPWDSIKFLFHFMGEGIGNAMR